MYSQVKQELIDEALRKPTHTTNVTQKMDEIYAEIEAGGDVTKTLINELYELISS